MDIFQALINKIIEFGFMNSQSCGSMSGGVKRWLVKLLQIYILTFNDFVRCRSLLGNNKVWIFGVMAYQSTWVI